MKTPKTKIPTKNSLKWSRHIKYIVEINDVVVGFIEKKPDGSLVATMELFIGDEWFESEQNFKTVTTAKKWLENKIREAYAISVEENKR